MSLRFYMDHQIDARLHQPHRVPSVALARAGDTSVYHPAMPLIVAPTPVDAILPLRHRILRAGLPFETARFEGDEEATSRHFAARDGDQIVGCATVHLRPFSETRPVAWQLRGMAVDEAYRRGGVGSRLLDAVIDHLRADGRTDLLWCRARKPAVPFYKRHGFEVVSDEYDVPTAGPHFTMVKRLDAPT